MVSSPFRGNAPLWRALRTIFTIALAVVSLSIARAAAPASPIDRAFLAWDIQIEIQQQDMGRLAERRAKTETVRDLGAMLVQRHWQAQQRLTQVASDLAVPLSTTLSEMHLRIQRRYATIAPSRFDKAFTQHEIGDYRYFLAHFEPEARTRNPVLRTYCTEQIAQLKQDQARIVALMTALNTGRVK